MKADERRSGGALRRGLRGSGSGRGAVLLFLCGALALGCSGTRLVSGGPFTGVVQTPEGTIRYSLAKTIVTVEATVTQGASGHVTFDGNEFSVDTKLVRKDAKAEVSFSTVADEDQYFTLRLEHGGSSDDSLTVDIGPNGMLRSVGATSTSQVGTMIKNVATIASSVAAGIVAATLGSDPRKQAVALVCEKLAAEAGTPGRCPALDRSPAPTPTPQTRVPTATAPTKAGTKAGTAPTPTPAPTMTTTADRPAPAGCDRRTEVSLGELSMANLYFLAKSKKHRQLWSDRRDAEALLGERTCRRAELERTAERATGKELEEVRGRLAMQRDLESAARVDLRTASDELDVAVRSFQLETGIDAPTRTEVVRVTLDLDEIPPPDMLHRAVAPEAPSRVSGMLDSDVRTALRSFPRMLDLYDRTGIALTLTPPPYAARGATVWSGDAPDTPKTRIYYRPSYTAVLTTYATSRAPDAQGGEQELLRAFAVASDEVIHPKMPVLGFAFEPAAFAERKMSLGFDDHGRLVHFEQAGKSSVVGATTAAVDALQSARAEYATTLERIADIQDTRRRLETNDLVSQIDVLQKQRTLLDERLELAGTRNNYDLLLEKKRLDAQLGVIQGRRSLSDSKSDPAISEEVAQLRAKLDQLARDVDALQHRNTGTTVALPTTAGK